MFNYTANDFELIRFFSYTSTIPFSNTKFELDPNWVMRNKYTNIKERFDIFYADIAEKAENMVKDAGLDYGFWLFKDNKTVYQIRHKYSGKVFFIGRYDLRCAIGNGCYLYDGRIFDFKTMKMSDYVSDIMANANGLWQKFNI